MSMLSRNIGSVIGTGLGLGLGGVMGPIGSFAGGATGATQGNKVMAQGQGQPGPTDNQGLSLSPQNQATANQIIQYIQSHNQGTYGEAQIGATVKSFDDLHNQVKSGKLSQADYVGIAQSILPKVYEYGQQIARSGSSGATAVNNAGLEKLNEHLANYNIYKSGQEILGRDLTPEEFAQAAPIFQQPKGETLGNAWMAQLKQVDDQNPMSAGNKKKSEGFGSNVDQIFQSSLGRLATADEKAHFGALMATGNLDQYGLNQFLQGTPEYQTAADTKFRTGLDSQLQQSDLNFFKNAKQDVMSQFMQNGTGNSSALDSALTDLMGKMATNRSQYLAQLSSQQYSGNKDLALSNYGNTQNQVFGNISKNTNRAQSLQDYYTGRSDNLADYNTQMQDYLNYANSAGSRKSNGFGRAAGGALQGGAAFAGTGNPYAIGAGAIGGGLLSYLNS